MGKLSQEKVDEMYDAYIEKQTIASIVQACNVNKNTALKYINDGDVDRGISSFKSRMITAKKEAEKVADDKSDIYKKETLSMVRNYKGKLWKLLKNIDEFDVNTVTPTKLVFILKTLGELEANLSGESRTTRVEHTHNINLNLPPEKLDEVARICLTHIQQTADEDALTIAAIEDQSKKGSVVDAEFEAVEDEEKIYATIDDVEEYEDDE